MSLTYSVARAMDYLAAMRFALPGKEIKDIFSVNPAEDFHYFPVFQFDRRPAKSAMPGRPYRQIDRCQTS